MIRKPEERDITTLSGLRIDLREHTVDVEEYGNAIPNPVLLRRDEIPEAIKILIDCAHEEDIPEIEARCRDALFWDDPETKADVGPSEEDITEDDVQESRA